MAPSLQLPQVFTAAPSTVRLHGPSRGGTSHAYMQLAWSVPPHLVRHACAHERNPLLLTAQSSEQRWPRASSLWYP